MALQFASLWVIAKSIGVTGVGQYAFYTSWMTVLAALSSFGSATYTLRTVAVYVKNHQHHAIRHYITKMGLILFASGMGVWLLIHINSRLFVCMFHMDASWLSQLAWAAIGSTAFMLMRLMTEALKSMDMPNVSMAIESMLIPLLLMGICGVMLWNGYTLSVDDLIGAHIAITGLSVLLMSCFIWRATQPTEHTVAPPLTTQHVLSMSLLPLWGSSLLGMLFLNMPILLLPLFANEEETGLFSMAYRFINVCVSLLMVIASIYGPRFAKAYVGRDIVALKSSLRHTQWLSLALYAPLFLIFVFASGFAMSLFGAEFRAGGSLLTAMAIGQLIYASTGLVGMMMNMIHREKEEFWISLASTVLMALLISTLGYFYAVMGMAIGFGLGLGLKNLASWFAVRHYLALIEPQSPNHSAHS